MPFYRFYLHGESPTPSEGAGLGDDRAALIYAYRFLEPGGAIAIWEGGRHVAQLWGERPSSPGPAHQSDGAPGVEWARISPPSRRRIR